MITGDSSFKRIGVYTFSPSNDWSNYVTNIEITRGGSDFGPYRGGPEVGTATVYMYFPPNDPPYLGDYQPGMSVEISTKTPLGLPYAAIFSGVIQDYNISYIQTESGDFGQRMSVYIADQVGAIQGVRIPGQVTSATTKNVSWETRMNTLATSLPSGSWTIPTTPQNHVFRLVDNNVDGSLADQFDLACNSVGATWYVNTYNQFQALPKGDYPTTGAMFTDTAGYWGPGNKPANSGTYSAYNLTFNDIEFGPDTANIVNTVELTNVMPKNMITRASTGALRYKDPATTPGPSLEVLEPTFTATDATSVTNYGIRSRELTTNVYPYRTSDTDSFYVRFNGYPDPGSEYQTTPDVYMSSNVAIAQVSSVTPYQGTYCLNIKMTTPTTSFGVHFGSPSGFPLKTLPNSSVNPYQVYFRTTNAKTRVRKDICFLDSEGNFLQVQSGATITPTLNTWVTNNTVFLNTATIPADAVAWLPRFVIQTSDSTNFPLGEIWKLDAISVNTVCDTSSYFTGDNADTATDLYSWEGAPGNSLSYYMRNVLDDIGEEVLDYWKLGKLNIRYLSWNGKQNWDAISNLEIGGRVDIHLSSFGADFTAWISRIRYSITPEDIIVKLDLSARPNSWI